MLMLPGSFWPGSMERGAELALNEPCRAMVTRGMPSFEPSPVKRLRAGWSVSIGSKLSQTASMKTGVSVGFCKAVSLRKDHSGCRAPLPNDKLGFEFSHLLKP